MFSWMFGSRKTPKEQLRDCKLEIKKNSRALSREVESLKQTEHQLLRDIKATAEQGKIPLAKIMCKNLVVIRQGIQKLYQSIGQINQIEISLTISHSTQVMAEAMAGATKAMSMANRFINMQQMVRIMKMYEQNSDKLEMKQELMNETMDGLNDDVEEEEEELLNQVMDEIGINLSDMLDNPPGISKKNPENKLKEQL